MPTLERAVTVCRIERVSLSLSAFPPGQCSGENVFGDAKTVLKSVLQRWKKKKTRNAICRLDDKVGLAEVNRVGVFFFCCFRNINYLNGQKNKKKNQLFKTNVNYAFRCTIFGNELNISQGIKLYNAAARTINRIVLFARLNIIINNFFFFFF